MTDDVNARYLGVECGGTRTEALLVDGRGTELERIALGPANLRLMSDSQLVGHVSALGNLKPTAVGVGMAGARTSEDRERVAAAVDRVWPGVSCAVTHDLDIALLSEADGEGKAANRVLVLSGTGSCCFGRTARGKTAKLGGWGHILGDKGSGYEIGLRGVKASVYYFDRDGRWPALGRRILEALQLNEPDDLIGWAREAEKDQVARLALEVFSAWNRKDKIATDILTGAAISLAKDGVSCARRLVKPGDSIQFVLAGGVLVQQPRFAAIVRQKLIDRMKGHEVTVKVQERGAVWGAVVLARSLKQKKVARGTKPKQTAPTVGSLTGLAKSPTERRNPRSSTLDQMSVAEGVRLMLSEESRVVRGLKKVDGQLEWLIRRVIRSFRNGGRLFYVGAGTSGRLGVLDASECPPTFRVPSDMVQGIIAGGQRALWKSVEGAEDDPSAGGRAVSYRGVRKKDVVIGIAASGRTPFVLGALTEAKRRGALSTLLCFNPTLKLPRDQKPDRVIAVDVGPEILTGSTRLKSGTATKLVLNMVTTLAMVGMGKVKQNLMIDVAATNEKLRDRAVRIVRELAEVDADIAKAALLRCKWDVGMACASLE